VFSINLPIRFQDADPAGVLFFARAFDLFHQAYESLMAERGLPLGATIKEETFLLPIVHAEGQFKKPAEAGETVKVEVKTGRRGVTSFTLLFTMTNSAGDLLATGSTVHVAVDKQSGKPVALPPKVIAVLETLEEE